MDFMGGLKRAYRLMMSDGDVRCPLRMGKPSDTLITCKTACNPSSVQEIQNPNQCSCMD